MSRNTEAPGIGAAAMVSPRETLPREMKSREKGSVRPEAQWEMPKLQVILGFVGAWAVFFLTLCLPVPEA